MSKMQCKAISRRKAEWIGMAAAVAGGYVAVDGPRIGRLNHHEYRALLEDACNDMVAWRREQTLAELAQYHQLARGDYARVLPYQSPDADLVLVVPADHPLAEEGYSLPASLVRELIPALQEAGYETAGLLALVEAEA